MARIRYAEDLKRLRAVIKVIGLGGAGGNAVNRMVEAGVQGVEIIAANTDAQHLGRSKAEVKVQIGEGITKGLGVGGDPAMGRIAGMESQEHLREVLAGADLVFITAGMGGGTGTGVAPVAAQVAKELNALTVAVVTRPFSFEGRVRAGHAENGIKELRGCVDTLLVIPNDHIFKVAGESMPSSDAYRKADDVLRLAVQAVSDIITQPGEINVDLNDIKAVMLGAGDALMGIGEALGHNRAVEAAKKAVTSPMLENISIGGATRCIMNVVGNKKVTIGETQEAANYVASQISPDAAFKFGLVYDEKMDDRIQITVIATGFPANRRSLSGRGHREFGDAPAKLAAAVDLATPAYMRVKVKRLR
ncbi:MAG TPA: cell division protein FtsZ [Elusimicrobia bacterium]|nr:cell division protein FtsZ [Elusimicrobiota bacterium]